LTAARIEPVAKFFEGERTSIELSTPSSLTSWRAVWKQLTCNNETEARAVSCDVIMVTSHFESFESILGHFTTFATPSALYQWSCLGLPYRAVGCTLYRSVTLCIHGSVAGLPILRGRCKVVPYAGVSLVAARSSSKRRYVPLVDNASSRHCALSALLPGWTFVVWSPMEAMFHSFHHPLPFFSTSLQFRRQYVRIILM